jgi:guanine deaminase
VVANGVIRATGEYSSLRDFEPDAVVRDWRGSVILPGFIDTHVHFPQTRIIGGLGWPLLDWLRLHALPEEVRMGDPTYARAVAAEFIRALARHGTTTALVFGAHFGEAMDCLFQAACAGGIRIASGLVLSDRLLPESLRQTPEQAYRISRDLIARYHGRNGQRYAVTPRFALSASEGMLEVCAALLREQPDLLFQTHINENPQEVTDVLAAFPWAESYLAVYDRFSLAGPRSVFAHNVHISDAELAHLAASGASVAHCPASNAVLGSGIFPMHRHLSQAVTLSPAHLLYLATRAGAEVLGLAAETGDFTPGKSADLVRLCPPEGTPLAAAVKRSESLPGLLAALIAQAGPESVREVRVRGQVLAI